MLVQGLVLSDAEESNSSPSVAGQREKAVLRGFKSIGIPSRLSHGGKGTILIKQRTLEQKYRRLLRDYDDISREYKYARNALNALTNTRDGAAMVMQLHLGEQLVSRIPSSTET